MEKNKVQLSNIVAGAKINGNHLFHTFSLFSIEL